MSSKDKNLTPVQQEYKKFEQEREPKRPVLKNCLKAFFVGGFICLIGQLISTFYITYFDFTERSAGNPTVATLIFISMLLTGFGVYDRLGQFAGAGTAVPVTGFGNSVISACIEHRTEGFVLGVGGNMFKLAGSVILFGVFSAFVIALIKTILVQWGGL
ncbi:TPA: stage V sporulation protein AC [Bacillus thuringiensis]|jgi:stage V sporulation protein AC|uniref:Stage V sporulation protein AC n=5 Tax=Bacillus cereus group TaxID=86661 RepID=A0A9X6W1H0_BACCE|nr:MULTISPECIES: stage V sporulation protein AC [Bacillus]ANN34941.1 stage V sporulation protein AC [Bacillus thuringiensis serovar coreanensis]MDM5372951.1 stage V sporulation protein AC [Bacillus bombysepticus]NIE91469.1 stage V sporulation protein AC [Bacillus sp. Ab-1751]BCA34150.1 stage V sporulation protein AC [Bacillus wiedmannii]AGE81116.1 Stage V sporulation protein AC [Bacillus thuringiensis serovar kurstaki str. HD73]